MDGVRSILGYDVVHEHMIDTFYWNVSAECMFDVITQRVQSESHDGMN
jgi:hypothetical protein